MKKTIMIMCLAAIMLLVGCDSKPLDFDHRTDGWKLWREGTIERKKIVMEKAGASTEQRWFVLEFVDGEDVRSTRMHDFDKMKEGETGVLYCWDGRDCDNTYMWIAKEGVASVSPKKKSDGGHALTIKTEKFYTEDDKVEEVIPPPKRYGWNTMASSPPIHQTVLVKFKNDLVTTAYYTPLKKWKAEVDRNKLSGGIALKDVVRWKIVDLE